LRVETSNSGAALRCPSRGAWRRIEGHLFQSGRELGLALAALAVSAAFALPAHASSTALEVDPRALARAQTIRVEMNARYRLRAGGELNVIDSTSTGVIDSFALLTPDLLETRFVPADNGIWYAICPVRATCPYPARRFARPAASFVPRRLALELALHTFLKTSADVVAVSLPTQRFIAFVVERSELTRKVDMPTLANALGSNPSRTLSSSLERLVDRVTRPRVFLWTALVPTPSGRDSWAGVPRWPAVTG
jgi:hypothetical protein